jgi:UDP-N-acetylglucosamine 2-epimerase (non-hydrolysing)
LKISVIFGTRPEAIKLAPVILALKREPDFECRVCVTAQHREMLDQVLEVFDIKPDADLDLMRPNQTLGQLTSRAMAAIDPYLAGEKPDLVLVQGDTTTVLCAALAAFYHHIPVGHVEAGLRTWNLDAPWPEEANRVLTSRLARLHFAPTTAARDNLLKEGVPDDRIFVTGNTVIDALFLALEKVRMNPPHIPGLPDFLQPSTPVLPGPEVPWSVVHGPGSPPNPQLVLITGHRRENFGDGFESICEAIADLARQFPDTHFVYPVHLNPNVREPVQRILGKGPNSHPPAVICPPSSALCPLPSTLSAGNVHLIEPLSYLPFVALMERATLILTDSGGVQEEAPSLGKPVLVMRETTERPEAVAAGTVKLVGTDKAKIVRETTELLTSASARRVMSQAMNPYGDGKAALRIVAACRNLAAIATCRAKFPGLTSDLRRLTSVV